MAAFVPLLAAAEIKHKRRQHEVAHVVRPYKWVVDFQRIAAVSAKTFRRYMAEYKRLKQAKTVLALCFAETTETYHHWRVFSHGADGVCIEFDKDRLLKVWSGDESVQTRAVAYKEIQQIRDQAAIALEDLPFIKRFPYRDEKEFRVIFVSEDEAVEHKDYPIQLTCIRRITLSPWMSKTLAASVKTTLKSIPGCAMIKVSRSTLVDNDAWKGFTARVAGHVPSGD
jgi:hypothetical protein